MTGLLRFIAGGGLATLVHGAVLSVLADLARVDPVLANVPAFIAAFAVSYTYHYHISFRSDAPHGRALLQYLLVALAGLCTSTAVLALAVRGAGLHYLPGFLIASGIVAAQTYLLGKRWVFTSSRS